MKILFNKITRYKFTRFVIVGGFNTLLDLVVLNLLISIFNVMDPFIFSICKGVSFVAALINSYFMNKYFTFSQRQKSPKEFYLFVLVSVIGLLINIAVSSLSFYLIGFYSHSVSTHFMATASGIIGALFSMVINYISYSYFVFK
jgi:putative flippase GtrA